MEQTIQLNEHNKQEYPPMHVKEFNTSSIYNLHPLVIFKNDV